ncbi:MAG TPA: efflux RND transporter periplasmic adaptor subunit, partial [Candidatus Cloacimonadota bacterium]|nr:efflux RND transporter periplasmic adaptor subunit [Candidatus Cloacimonadota bacterium]
MKKRKILTVLILCVVVLAVITALSYVIEAHSQKLPAVVSSEKVIVSSEVDGLMKSYAVASMQKVNQNDLIAEISNTKIPYKLETLKKEKQKYEELINSAHSGDFLKNEVYDIDKSIQSNQSDLDKAQTDYGKTCDKLQVMRDRFNNSLKQFQAEKNLYNQGIINTSEFDKASREYWDVNKEYTELKSDSISAQQMIKTSLNIRNLLQARKNIMTNNVDILASKYILDLNDVEADINDLQQEVNNFRIHSPISGVVTDINYLPGEKIDRGDDIAEIADLSKIWITAYGSSSSSHQIHPGQRVRVMCSRNKNIMGTVSTV